MDISFAKRPTKQETEQDLIAQNKQFISPSAVETEIINGSNEEVNVTSSPKKKKSLFAQRMEEKRKGQSCKANVSKLSSSGFPVAEHQNLLNNEQQEISDYKKCLNQIINSAVPENSHDIHNENISFLLNMSNEDIEGAKESVLQNLDVKSIKFLKSRSEGKYSKMKEINNDEKANLVIKEIDGCENLFEESAESEKLSWTKTSLVNSEHSDVRFDFKGEIIEKTSIPSHSGLYHHGDQPDLPGYTILELLHLSKSTVLTQRVISFKTISRIVKKIYNAEYSTHNISSFLLKLQSNNLLLSLRIGIDQSNPSLVSQSLTCLSTYLGCNPSDKRFQDILFYLFLTTHGERSFAISRESQLAFKCKSLGREMEQIESGEKPETFSEISNICREDYIVGLLSTNILVRFRFLLETVSPAESQHADIVSILTRFASHSTSTAEDILECPGLIDVLQSSMFKNSSWPSISNAEYILNHVRLFRVLSQASRQACESLLRHKIIDQMVLIIFNSDAVHYFPAD